jgi:hypothetical protein
VHDITLKTGQHRTGSGHHKDLQNPGTGSLRPVPRRRSVCFETNILLEARTAFYLKEFLGISSDLLAPNSQKAPSENFGVGERKNLSLSAGIVWASTGAAFKGFPKVEESRMKEKLLGQSAESHLARPEEEILKTLRETVRDERSDFAHDPHLANRLQHDCLIEEE